MKNVIRNIRENMELSQADFAAMLGVGTQTIFDIEHYNRVQINDKVLDVLDNELDYDRSEIVGKYQKGRKDKRLQLIEDNK